MTTCSCIWRTENGVRTLVRIVAHCEQHGDGSAWQRRSERRRAKAADLPRKQR